MGTLLLARHGETTWNREGRVQGWAPVSLTDRGRRQAAALADFVTDSYDVGRLVASDIERAQETVRPLAAELALEPAFDPSWRERDVGALQGLHADELFARYPQYALSEVGAPAARERPPSGESLVDVRRRVLTAFDGLVSSLDDDETALVVSHGGPIRLVLGSIKGLEVTDAILSQSVDNGCLCELGVDADDEDASLRIVVENETNYLADVESSAD